MKIMEWIEARVITKSDAVELVTGLLMANNIPNVRIIDDEEVERFLLDHPLNWDYKDDIVTSMRNRPDRATAKSLEHSVDSGAEVIFYVQDDEIGSNILSEIECGLKDLVENVPEIDFGILELKSGPVNDDDWLHEWKKTYKPFSIGKKVIVRPFWEDASSLSLSSETVVFTIDPGAVFGTGLHATTQLCILALEDLELEGKTVLDIGCGSGILSVIALLLGAESAVACDIDPSAIRSATENARLNNIDPSRYSVYTGDISVVEEKRKECKDQKFDIILANIVADVIIDILPDVRKYLKDDGLFIASGIIDDREEDVKAALMSAGYSVNLRQFKDGWVCFVA